MRLAAALALLALSSTALAAPKRGRLRGKTTGPVGSSAPACGAKMLPLVVGNSWTYESVAAPEPPPDAIKRLSPMSPKTVIITVTAIDAKKGGEAVITLEEKLTFDHTKDDKKPVVEERTLTTQIACDDKKFDIAPESFFFAAEPGGYYGLEIGKLDRVKGTSWQLVKGLIGEAEWREDLVLTWTKVATVGSDAKLGGGKLELERQFTPQQPEAVATKLGAYQAEKLGLVTTGRASLEPAQSPELKPMELPAGWISQLWVAENVGVVQTLNSFGHMYQLADVTLK
jgi:hypothetical protein